jgi:hypothetical protein
MKEIKYASKHGRKQTYNQAIKQSINQASDHGWNQESKPAARRWA